MDPGMDYNNYFTNPAQSYPFYHLPSKPDHPYTPQDDAPNNPIDAYNDPNAFHPFDPSYHFGQNPLVPPPPQSPPQSVHRPSISNVLPQGSSNSIEMMGDQESYEQAQGRSSEEDRDNVTPAQGRRKAQNRAAQRAFRERKERHVKELEVKLNTLEADKSTITSENERLKRELEKVNTQNEILRATTTPLNLSHQNTRGHVPAQPPPPDSPIPGPQTYSPAAFHESLSNRDPNTSNQPISHRIQVHAATGERLLTTGAAWDMIQSHEMFKKGMIDIADVCSRLKGLTMCDGSGPAFEEGVIRRAIEESVGGPGDELI